MVIQTQRWMGSYLRLIVSTVVCIVALLALGGTAQAQDPPPAADEYSEVIPTGGDNSHHGSGGQNNAPSTVTSEPSAQPAVQPQQTGVPAKPHKPTLEEITTSPMYGAQLDRLATHGAASAGAMRSQFAPPNVSVSLPKASLGRVFGLLAVLFVFSLAAVVVATSKRREVGDT